MNVGGQMAVTVARHLLTLAGENALSGFASVPVEIDDDTVKGSLFVDYSPEVFLPLLDWLRRFRDSQRDRVVELVIDRRHRAAWLQMMIALAFEPYYIQLAGVEPMELLDTGHSHEKLRLAGYLEAQLPDIPAKRPSGGLPPLSFNGCGTERVLRNMKKGAQEQLLTIAAGMQVEACCSLGHACCCQVAAFGKIHKLLEMNAQDVGGQALIEVCQDLLHLAGENTLSVMVSGRWKPPTTADGNLFPWLLWN